MNLQKGYGVPRMQCCCETQPGFAGGCIWWERDLCNSSEVTMEGVPVENTDYLLSKHQFDGETLTASQRPPIRLRGRPVMDEAAEMYAVLGTDVVRCRAAAGARVQARARACKSFWVRSCQSSFAVLQLRWIWWSGRKVRCHLMVIKPSFIPWTGHRNTVPLWLSWLFRN